MIAKLIDDISQAINVLGAMRDRQKMRAAAERYLDSRPYTLYADFDISRAERKAEAAEWLTNQVLEVLRQIGDKHD